MACRLFVRCDCYWGIVPAAIMAIAASNLFTRNIYREYTARKLHRAKKQPLLR